jgi:hypothetical protein
MEPSGQQRDRDHQRPQAELEVGQFHARAIFRKGRGSRCHGKRTNSLSRKAMQSAVVRSDEDGRPPSEFGQDRLADASSERNGPQQPRFAVTLAEGMQLAIVASKEHLRAAVPG